MSAPTLHSAVLGTTEVYGIRELNNMANVATFDAGFADASIDPTTIRFVNDANQKLRELRLQNPLQCPFFIPKTEGFSLIADQKYAVDLSTIRYLSAVETEAQVFKYTSAPRFETSAAGLSMLLLKNEGAFANTDFVNVPYTQENRTRILELLTLGLLLIQIQKSIFDEVFKIVNIVSDILSGAAIITIPAGVVATLNLVTSLINLVVLINKFILLITDNIELIMPPIRLHKGINLYQYLLKGCQYMGIGLQMGDTLTSLCKQIVLTPSKSDEVGLKTSAPVSPSDLVLGLLPNQGDGLLRPSDFGYTLGEAIDFVKNRFNCRSAIKDNVYHLRTKKDPFWLQSPSYVIPDVLIEQALNYDNGWYEYNYNDIVCRYLISYAKDETDMHTLTDTNNRMSEVIFDHPIDDRKRTLLKEITEVDIDYALCVRKGKNPFDTVFLSIVNLVNSFKDVLQPIFDANTILGQSLPLLETMSIENWVQEGALLVENNFFGKPKVVLLDENGRIPNGFEKIIGADALWTNWHAFNSMAPGWKNPAFPNQSNQKIIFREVKIPFGITSWQETIVNSQCVVPGYGGGEFIKINWNTGNDHAIVDFFAYTNWAPDLTGELWKIQPENTVTTPTGNPGI